MKSYSPNMTYATILVALVLIACLVRIYFLNSEIKELDDGAKKFLSRVEKWRSTLGGVEAVQGMPREIEEAQTEYEWAMNARDSKKESRTIWLGASALALVALVAAIVELSRP